MEEHDGRPGSYDLEELIYIGHLEDELARTIEQILSVDQINGMMRIEQVLARVRNAPARTIVTSPPAAAPVEEQITPADVDDDRVLH